MDPDNIYSRVLYMGHKEHDTRTVVRCENPKCGSHKVRVAEMATRSADETVTLFVTCTLCKHVYIIAD